MSDILKLAYFFFFFWFVKIVCWALFEKVFTDNCFALEIRPPMSTLFTIGRTLIIFVMFSPIVAEQILKLFTTNSITSGSGFDFHFCFLKRFWIKKCFHERKSAAYIFKTIFEIDLTQIQIRNLIRFPWDGKNYSWVCQDNIKEHILHIFARFRCCFGDAAYCCAHLFGC